MSSTMRIHYICVFFFSLQQNFLHCIPLTGFPFREMTPPIESKTERYRLYNAQGDKVKIQCDARMVGYDANTIKVVWALTLRRLSRAGCNPKDPVLTLAEIKHSNGSSKADQIYKTVSHDSREYSRTKFLCGALLKWKWLEFYTWNSLLHLRFFFTFSTSPAPSINPEMAQSFTHFRFLPIFQPDVSATRPIHLFCSSILLFACSTHFLSAIYEMQAPTLHEGQVCWMWLTVKRKLQLQCMKDNEGVNDKGIIYNNALPCRLSITCH